MKILVLNAGSSSLKFQLFDMEKLLVLASGLIEQIGEQFSQAKMDFTSPAGRSTSCQRTLAIPDHQEAIETMVAMLKENGCMTGMAELAGIGHRVVHGGENFHAPTLIDDQVLATITDLIPLAPLHNPANVIGIKVAQQRAPHIPQVAVFDTAFHQSIPKHGYIYGVPYELYETQRVRRYGFHGTSHQYVAGQAAHYLGKESTKIKLISLHLGNGTSAAAIHHGHCLDTSMGMTPLEGLLMGTRCGDIDPAIPFYLARQTGMTFQQLDDLLNKQSGLKGICGQNDMRAIIDQAEAGEPLADLALTIFCYRIKKYIGAYLAVLNGADAIIFTGGIGENASLIRQHSCADLDNFGIIIDDAKNNHRSKEIMEIQDDRGTVKILVIPTNEELEIARQTIKLVQQ